MNDAISSIQPAQPADESPKIRFGIVGAGLMATTYARAFRHLVPSAEAVAINGGSGAAGLADEFGLDVEPTLEALLDRNDIDAVLLATPTQFHHVQTLAAAAARKHVYTEKPMATSLAHVDEMIAACKAANVRLAVNAVTRYRKGMVIAKRLVDEGAIGEIRMVRHTYAHLQNSFAPPDNWLLDPKAGSPFLDVGSHANDAIRWFVGDEVREVYAHYATHEPGPEGLSAMVTLVFEHGVMCSIWSSYEFPPPGLDPTKWTGDYLFVGSEGMIDVQYRGTCRLGKGDHWETLYEHPALDGHAREYDPNFVYAYAEQVQDFAMAVLEGREPHVTGETARKAIEIGLAADRSAATGQVVRLPL